MFAKLSPNSRQTHVEVFRKRSLGKNVVGERKLGAVLQRATCFPRVSGEHVAHVEHAVLWLDLKGRAHTLPD